MADKKPNCGCNAAPRLIFPCSGAADVGAIADQAARTLTKDGVGKMYCLAGIGGRVSGIMESTKAASAILVIDGCPQDCAKNTLLQAGFSKFKHLRLSDIGMEKGKSPADAERISKAAGKGAELLGPGCCA